MPVGLVLTIILIFLLLMLLIGLAAVGTTVFGARKVKRHYQGKQELVPGHKSVAPIKWNGSPKREALQHRRLVNAMTLARSVHSPTEADALGKQAIMIEHELVRAALLRGPARKQALDTTESLVSSVEELSRGVYERNNATPEIRNELTDLRDRLHALAEAHRELDQHDVGSRGFGQQEPG